MDETIFQLLRDQVAQGFEGVNARLDRLNGKVERHEVSLIQLKLNQEASERVAQQIIQDRAACTVRHDTALGALRSAFDAHESAARIDASVRRRLWTIAAVAGSVAGTVATWVIDHFFGLP